MKLIILITACALGLLSWSAFAQPPYDVEVTVTAPTDGGPVDRYALYLDDVEIGTVTEGVNAFPGLLTAEGEYVFQVGAINTAGETRSAPVTVNVTEVSVPGTPTIQVQVSCDPCVLTINP